MQEESIDQVGLPKPVLAVDLGGTKILAAVIDSEGRILSREKKKTKAHKSPPEVISRIARCARAALESAGLPPSAVAGLGIGAPGALNPQTGVIHLAPNLHWENVPIKSILEQEIQIPVFVNNDVNVGALGECRLGAGVGKKNVVGVFVGTGIGGGLILNGRVYEGSSFMAGEIGHIPMVENGPRCGCGNKGCLEAVAGRLAIVRDITERLKKGKKSMLTQKVGKDVSRIKSRLLAEAWSKKDPLVVKVLEKAAFYIGRSVGTVITLFNPDAVILGGGLIEAIDEDFIEYITQSARESAFSPMFRESMILRASLGDDAGILGAACYARDCLLEK